MGANYGNHGSKWNDFWNNWKIKVSWESNDRVNKMV